MAWGDSLRLVARLDQNRLLDARLLPGTYEVLADACREVADR